MSDWEHEAGAHWADNADRYTRVLRHYGALLVDALAPAPGERVLDIGCGNGDLSLATGRAVGHGGAVLGVDLSPDMLAVARGRAEAEGLHHVEFVQADAASWRTPTAPFAAATSRFGVMFFDEPAAAFANLRGSMVPGARLVFVCWQSLLDNEWMLLPAAAASEVLAPPPPGDPTAPGPFAFADGDRVAALLTEAGFGGIDLEAVSAPVWVGHDADDAAGFLRDSGVGRTWFADAPPALVDEALARAADAVRPHEGPDGIELGGAAWLVRATA
ncbi:MAG: methyltransferase domain-containing protein [Microthrixaceae bacterium]|nr:methyltransferase domain-containing protein [Microthrixaceae bacterium]